MTLGVQVYSGSLDISGADTKIEVVTGDPFPRPENDGAIRDGAAISIVNRAGFTRGLDKITVTEGTFTAKEGNEAVKAYNWTNKETGEENFTASATSQSPAARIHQRLFPKTSAQKATSVTNGDGITASSLTAMLLIGSVLRRLTMHQKQPRTARLSSCSRTRSLGSRYQKRQNARSQWSYIESRLCHLLWWQFG